MPQRIRDIVSNEMDAPLPDHRKSDFLLIELQLQVACFALLRHQGTKVNGVLALDTAL